MSRWRTTLIDPAVEPAEPPTNMSAKRVSSATDGQRAKSALAMPVVVTIETVWKNAGPDRLLALGDAVAPELGCERSGGDGQEHEVQPELLVAYEPSRLPADERPIHDQVVRAGEQHEERHHPLRGRRERRRGVGLGREPAGRHDAERVRDRLVEVHPLVDAGPAESCEEEDEQRREPDVQGPEQPRRLADPLGELRDLRPGHLVLEELSPPDAQAREDRDRQHDDPHPSEPLRELPPQAERPRDLVVVGDDARAGRREAGHALEVGVDRVPELVAADQEVRDRGEGCGEEPGRRDDEEPSRTPTRPAAADVARSSA